MQSGAEGVLHRANHVVHLVAAGAWIGGLVPFAMCLRAYERDDLRKDAVRAMAGFSFWGQLIVAAILLTGVVNIALTSDRPPLPPVVSVPQQTASVPTAQSVQRTAVASGDACTARPWGRPV